MTHVEAPREARGGLWRAGLLGVVVIVASFLLVAGAELTYRVVKTKSVHVRPVMFVGDSTLVYRINPARADIHGGFRGPGQAPIDRHDGIVVVCLGGSTTWGHAVSAERAWPIAAQDSLRAAGASAWVLNAGVPGYGSRQLLRRFQSQVIPLKPDYVIVYEGWNRTGALVDPDAFVPFGVFKPGRSPLSWIVAKLAPYSLLVRDAAAPFDRRVVERVGRWHPDPDESIWEQDMDSLVAQIGSHGIQPVVVVYPTLYHPGMTAEDREAYKNKGWLRRPFDPGMLEEIQEKHAALRRIAAAHGAIVIDAESAIEALRGKDRQVLFLDEWHLSKVGNARVAGLVATAILEDRARHRVQALTATDATRRLSNRRPR